MRNSIENGRKEKCLRSAERKARKKIYNNTSDEIISELRKFTCKLLLHRKTKTKAKRRKVKIVRNKRKNIQQFKQRKRKMETNNKHPMHK